MNDAQLLVGKARIQSWSKASVRSFAIIEVQPNGGYSILTSYDNLGDLALMKAVIDRSLQGEMQANLKIDKTEIKG